MKQLSHPQLADVPLERVLFALGDPVRLAIVRIVADGQEHARGDFGFDLAQSTISHHVKTLRSAGIICARQDATRCVLSLRPELAQRFPGLIEAVLAQDHVCAEMAT